MGSLDQNSRATRLAPRATRLYSLDTELLAALAQTLEPYAIFGIRDTTGFSFLQSCTLLFRAVLGSVTAEMLRKLPSFQSHCCSFSIAVHWSTLLQFLLSTFF